jgi:hypothetical protein
VESRTHLSLGLAAHWFESLSCGAHPKFDKYFVVYRDYGNENISIVPFLAGDAAIHSANLEVARQVSAGGHRSAFVKPEEASRALL